MTLPRKSKHIRKPEYNRPIALVGDEITDILLPEEGRHRLSISKATQSDEPLTRMDAILLEGGVRHIEWILDKLGCECQIISRKDRGEAQDFIHWDLRSCPQNLFEDQGKHVYRVTDRHVHSSGPRKSELFNARVQPSNIHEYLAIIADYNGPTARSSNWDNFSEYLKGTKKHSGVNKIIILGSQLPHGVVSGRHSEYSPLWKYLLNSSGMALEGQPNTVIITNIDRLRQEGAHISKRKSWDQTLYDFKEALEKSPVMNRLASFGHLIVRVGVCGAFYTRVTSYDKLGIPEARETLLIYDPTAKAGIFRDLTSQGNVFATRSALAACIAAELCKKGKKSDVDAIEAGIKNGICVNQALYVEGFGSSLAEVRLYPSNITPLVSEAVKLGKSKPFACVDASIFESSAKLTRSWGAILMRNLRCSLPSSITSSDSDDLRVLQEIRRFRCAMRIVLTGVNQVINAHRCPEYLEGKPLSAYQDLEKAALELNFSERLDVEQAIGAYFNKLMADWDRCRFYIKSPDKRNPVHGESEVGPYAEVSRTVHKIDLAIKRWGILVSEISGPKINAENLKGAVTSLLDLGREEPNASQVDESMRSLGIGERTAGELVDFGEELDYKEALDRVVQAGGCFTMPFAFPFGSYGKLLVVGKREQEAFNDIRNRILFHIQSGSKSPLSLAVFGSPGNGKSFGVREIAMEIGGHHFKEITCNLSQGSGPEYLNAAFVEIADALAKHKTPLVFFDEFDAGLGDTEYAWLKYFLQPMQDGYYNHPDGTVGVGNSVFIFIGGTHKQYETFELDTKDPKKKSLKLPDFVSRLKGFVNIPDINPLLRSIATPAMTERTSHDPMDRDDDDETPYIRRAVLLRSMLERNGMILGSNSSSSLKKGRGLIDPDLLRALLMVRVYRHGARSMQAILETSTPFYNAVTKASLPTSSQMNLHTKGDEFFELLEPCIKDGRLTPTMLDSLKNGPDLHAPI